MSRAKNSKKAGRTRPKRVKVVLIGAASASFGPRTIIDVIVVRANLESRHVELVPADDGQVFSNRRRLRHPVQPLVRRLLGLESQTARESATHQSETNQSRKRTVSK